jgi:hypothetical protein
MIIWKLVGDRLVVVGPTWELDFPLDGSEQAIDEQRREQVIKAVERQDVPAVMDYWDDIVWH